MSNIPRPRSSDERVFVSAYRHDGIRTFLIKVLMPLAGVFCLLAFPYFAYRFSAVFQEIPEAFSGQIRLLIGMMVFLGISTAGCFFYLSKSLRTRLFETIILFNDRGLVFRSGKKEFDAPWEEIREIKARAVGRFQNATVVSGRGKFSFDASYCNAHGPQPKIAFGWKAEKMIFPNSDVKPILIEENDLVGMIRRKLAALEKKRNQAAASTPQPPASEAE